MLAVQPGAVFLGESVNIRARYLFHGLISHYIYIFLSLLLQQVAHLVQRLKRCKVQGSSQGLVEVR